MRGCDLSHRGQAIRGALAGGTKELVLDSQQITFLKNLIANDLDDCGPTEDLHVRKQQRRPPEVIWAR